MLDRHKRFRLLIYRQAGAIDIITLFYAHGSLTPLLSFCDSLTVAPSKFAYGDNEHKRPQTRPFESILRAQKQGCNWGTKGPSAPPALALAASPNGSYDAKLNLFNRTLTSKRNHRVRSKAIGETTVQGSEPVVIVLDEMLGTAAAAALRDRLLQVKGKDVTLDVSKVRHLGGLCAQVLLATAVTWRGAGRKFALSGTNESFLGAVQTLGLINHLSCEA